MLPGLHLLRHNYELAKLTVLLVICCKLVHSWNTGASLSWLYCDNSYYTAAANSASDVSALLVCMALHPQITRRQFSVVPMSIWTSQNSSTVSPSVVSDSHWHVGMLPGSYSFIVFVDNLHKIQWSPLHSIECMQLLSRTWVEHVDILKYMEYFRVYTYIGNQSATNMV